MAKCLAGGVVRFPKRLHERRVNEKAAKIFVAEIDFFQPDGKGPKRRRDARGPANQLPARAHAASQQRDVRGKFRCGIPGTQLVDDPRQSLAHVSSRH